MPSDAAVTPLATVIVPCFNSERTIRQCLQSLLDQRTSVPHEIVVVDSSTDSTPLVVEQEFPSVRLIHLDRRTFAGAARNIGIKAGAARYCIMIDSDCIASGDVVDRMMSRHLEENYAAVGGAIVNGTPRSLSGLIGYLIEFKEFIPSSPLRAVTSVPTANICYRRDALERHGLFDDDLWLGEDILLNWKIHTSGEKILFDPDIQVVHQNRTGWRTVLSYQADLGRMSAVARHRGGLPGSALLKWPILVALVPFMRLWRAWKWLAGNDFKLFLTFNLIWPAYLLAASIWSYGFFKEAMRLNRSIGNRGLGQQMD